MLDQPKIEIGMDFPMINNDLIFFRVRHVFSDQFMAERTCLNIVNPVIMPFNFNGKNLDGMIGFNLDMSALLENVA